MFSMTQETTRLQGRKALAASWCVISGMYLDRPTHTLTSKQFSANPEVRT